MQRQERAPEDALQVHVDGAHAGLMGFAALGDGEDVVDEVAAAGAGAGVEEGDLVDLREQASCVDRQGEEGG